MSYAVVDQVNILKDVTGHSTCKGEVSDFTSLFNSRYTKLHRILRDRISPMSMGFLNPDQRRVEVIGMVSSIRETQKGHMIIELEDPSGTVNSLVVRGSKAFEDAKEVVHDEVIGIQGRLTDRFLLVADKIIFPDVPREKEVRNRPDMGVVFTSDIHVGSDTFLKDAWNRFIAWINGEVGEGRLVELASSIEYVIVSGDLVDGVGIYPGQEKELEIVDVHEQYEKVAEAFDMIPKRIKIVVAPGNHDAVRQAEPQPALPKEIQSLFTNNVHFVGNPSYVDLKGLKVLVYHGRSLDTIVSQIPECRYEDPRKPMIELLKKRHLCPVYGDKAPIAPESEDYLVIDEVPDVLHCGHIHTFGYGSYKGVLVFNTGTWQSQTSYQRKMNLNPVPGNVIVYNPSKGLVRLKFY